MGLGQDLVSVLPHRLSVLLNVIVLQFLMIADTLFNVMKLALYLQLLLLHIVIERLLTLAAL